MTMPQCRLCNSELKPKFQLKMLGKYDIHFFECSRCHSLQTEVPYWLDEAYGNQNLSNLDTGAARRNIHNLAACFAISKLFGFHNVIDIGGGDGLLCRMLRDYGINCFVKDKYASPIYAQGFTEPTFDKPDLVIGFEVLEHFANPQADLDDLFGYHPKALLMSTAMYTNQGSDWWYLLPESGQHVFFYSRQALEFIAKKYQYSLIVSGGFILFIRHASALQIFLAKILLKEKICRLIRSLVVVLPAPGILKDQLLQVQQAKHQQSSQKNGVIE